MTTYPVTSEEEAFRRASEETERDLLPNYAINEVISLYDIPDSRFVNVVLCLSDHPILVQALLEGSPQRHASDTLVELPKLAGHRHEPVIKGKGVPVWVIVAYAIKHEMTPDQISDLWMGHVTVEEIQAAIAYWLKYPEAVEDKLVEAN